jgi:hypothetical protein
VIHDANGNYKDMLAGSGENEFTVIPRPVSNIFEDKGIHNATAFTDKQKLESGFTIRLEFDGEKVFVIPDFVLELKFKFQIKR